MVPEVVLSPEGLVADVTRVGSLICVRSLVDQKVVRLCKMASAKFADKLLFGLGGQPTPIRLALRGGELGHVQETSQAGHGEGSGGLRGSCRTPHRAQLLRFHVILLRGGRR